jgi:hypothetical protein
MTFEFRGNERENFNNRLSALPQLPSATSAVVVPYNPIRKITQLPSSLAILSIRGCEIHRLDFLTNCPDLIALDVSGNSLDYDGGMDLANYLSSPSCARKLQKLHFSGCHIPIQAMVHIVRALESLPKLRDVDMSRNVAVVNSGNGDLVTSETQELFYHLENLFVRNSSLSIANLGFMSL